MSQIAVIGHFMDNAGEASVNGQAIKTNNIYTMLLKRYGENKLYRMDTNNFKNHILYNYCKLVKLSIKCKILVILPTYNGLFAIIPLLSILKPLYKFKIIYPVVGGWLPEKLAGNSFLNRIMRCVDLILPESEKMVNSLNILGHKNVVKMPNFSTRKMGFVCDCNADEKKYRFCTFSRVTKEKGISDAIDAIATITTMSSDKGPISLDIYGPIDPKYKDEFETKIQNTSANIQYKGVLSGNEIIPTLSQYYCMLFPTYYPGEGMPGAVIEAFCAQLPVIATDWHDNAEVITHEYNGLIYPTKNQEKLCESILRVINDPELMKRLRNGCDKTRQSFSPENVMKTIYDYIDEHN